ncbi:MAG TPA: DUF4363 family protein [Anaerovoracaceae bacterium]|nr:DUF4363 family protein [Anaerovoracaceae bacterium]
MKSLIASSLILATLLGAWICFDIYSNNTLHDMTDKIDIIVTSVEAENWKESYAKVNALNKDWHRYKKVASFFLNTQHINDADYGFAKSVKYVKAQDVSNGSGELANLKEQLKFLHDNESLTLANIL